MSLPRDINILVSMLNMKLRDDDISLDTIIEIAGEDYQTIISFLNQHGYIYDQTVNAIKQK